MTVNVRHRMVMLLACMICHFLVQAQLPVLKINQKEDPNVYLSNLSIDVKIAGNIAITTMEMSFSNKGNQILEGELIFPLPEGVSVSRYALDMNGQMREAVPVEKQKATEVFEEIQHRRVDPGILEKVEGNNFRTRIYPIPARGERKVIIAYEEFLSFNEDQSLRYHLPMDHKKPIDIFKLHVSVIQSSFKPIVEEEPDNDLQFKEWNSNYAASISKEHFTPSQSLTVTIPKKPDNTEAMMQEVSGNYYFLVNCFPQKAHRAKPKPREISVLWDASLSGLNRDIKKELDLLGKYMEHNGNLLVTLCVVNNTFKKVNEFNISNGNWKALKLAIEQLNYDGGTNYSKITFPASDEYLLFTDGMSSLGNGALSLPEKPVYAISSAARSDFSWLQYIAQKSGGAFINLNTLKVADALPLLTQQSLQFLGVKQNRLVSETYPSIPMPVVNNCSVTGIATASTTIVLQFGYGNTVTEEKRVSLDYSKQAVRDLNLQRVWAQKKIGELDVQYESNKELIGFLGKQFSIVTRNTSLIVLETVQDYVRYEIEPPADLRNQYDQLMKQQLVMREGQQRVTLASALQNLDRLMTWWQRAFIPDKKPVPIKKDDNTSAASANNRTSRNQHNDDRARADSVAPYHGNAFSTPQPSTPAHDAAAMQEVVVVGHGTRSKRVTTGNVATVSSDDLNDLLKRTPGMAVTSSNSVNGYFSFSATDSRQIRTSKQGTYTGTPSQTSITLQQWTPERTYLRALQKASAGARYEMYLSLRKDYLYTPTFYYDVAGYFFREKDMENGMRILTNMAELDLENHELYKLLGFKLRETGAYDEALAVFLKILNWRPQEPQSYRDYGLALADAGKYQQALDTLYTALKKNYSESISGMYPGVEEIIVTEINQLISLHKNKLDLSGIDAKLVKDMPVDVRIVLSWNKNDTDIDLWVTDPHAETCYYGHKETLSGGRISNDFTRGYGPEQFMLKKAVNGKYQIKVNYYGDQQFKISGPTTVMAEIFTHYASGQQERKMITLQMDKEGNKSGILVGEFQFGG